jgi:hypothetical protein
MRLDSNERRKHSVVTAHSGIKIVFCCI